MLCYYGASHGWLAYALVDAGVLAMAVIVWHATRSWLVLSALRWPGCAYKASKHFARS